jgi:hypothetical protein
MLRAKTARVLTEVELVKVAGQFRLLGEPMRLKILQVLSVRPLIRAIADIKASGAKSAGHSMRYCGFPLNPQD